VLANSNQNSSGSCSMLSVPGDAHDARVKRRARCLQLDWSER